MALANLMGPSVRDPFDTGKRAGTMRVHEERKRTRTPKRTPEQERADLRTYIAHQKAILDGTTRLLMPPEVHADFGKLQKKYAYDPEFFDEVWSKAR